MRFVFSFLIFLLFWRVPTEAQTFQVTPENLSSIRYLGSPLKLACYGERALVGAVLQGCLAPGSTFKRINVKRKKRELFRRLERIRLRLSRASAPVRRSSGLVLQKRRLAAGLRALRSAPKACREFADSISTDGGTSSTAQSSSSQSSCSFASSSADGSSLKPDLAGMHPRLFFKAGDFAALRRRAQTSHKEFIDRVLAQARSRADRPPVPLINSNDTEAMRYAWWILPQIVVAYNFADSADRAALAQKGRNYVLDLAASPDWQSGEEANIGMGAANILAGVAIAYDGLYDLFTAQERAAIRGKIFRQVKLLYENGFLMKQDSTHYWQNDHANNHMHHRVAGLMLGALAVCDEVPEGEAYARRAAAEAAKVAAAIAPDGSSHESPTYWLFGTTYIVPAFYALRHAAGLDLFPSTEFFRNAPYYRTHMLAPGQKLAFDYGDGGTDPYYFANFLFFIAGEYRDGRMQAMMDRAYQAAPSSFIYDAWNFLWWDASLPRRPIDEIETWRYFSDIEIASARSGWNQQDTAILFKSGPYGGHRANQMRNGRYLNVAHDRPDGNSFTIFSNGRFLITHGNYADYYDRYAADHNTILVDGAGQLGEGISWAQPFANMENIGRITEFHGSPGYVFFTGDATGYYPKLSEYLRSVVFAANRYYVVFDSIKAPQPVRINWHFHGPAGWQAAGGKSWRIIQDEASLDLRVFEPLDASANLVSKKSGTRQMLDLQTGAGTRQTSFLGSFIPQPAGETVQHLQSSSAAGLRVIRPGGEDFVLMAKAGPILVDNLTAAAEAAVITYDGSHKITDALLIKGLQLQQAGVDLLTCSQPLNVRLQAAGKDFNLWLALPLTSPHPAGVQATLKIAAAQANASYLLIDGGGSRSLGSGASGVLEFAADLTNPAYIQLKHQQ